MRGCQRETPQQGGLEEILSRRGMNSTLQLSQAVPLTPGREHLTFKDIPKCFVLLVNCCPKTSHVLTH